MNNWFVVLVVVPIRSFGGELQQKNLCNVEQTRQQILFPFSRTLILFSTGESLCN